MYSPKSSIKWKASDYKYPFQHWTPPELVYPCQSTEKDALHALKNLFQPLPPYQALETQAKEENTQVTLDTPLPDGHIAFLENTAEKMYQPHNETLTRRDARRKALGAACQYPRSHVLDDSQTGMGSH